MTNDPMEAGFAVFNGHVNDAAVKADVEFVRLFGQKMFDRHIAPHHAEGIMTILSAPANRYRTAWIAMVTVLVNEQHARASFRDAIERSAA